MGEKIAWIRRSLLKIFSVLILMTALVLFLTDLYIMNQNRYKLVSSLEGWGYWNWSVPRVDNYEKLYEIWKEIQIMHPVSLMDGKQQRPTPLHMMKSRLNTVSTVCNYYRLSEKDTLWQIQSNKDETDACSPDRCSVLVDESTDIFFCFIPKVASTKFKHYFLTLIDINVSSNYMGFHSDANFFLKRVSPSYYTQTDLSKYFYKKILFVRHPFRRLVSVYMDKLVKPRGRTIIVDGRELTDFYYAYSIPIMKRYRGVYYDESKHPPLTFGEFVEYLIETPPIYYNSHWIPYWIRCEPCRVKYDYIGKIETIDTDSKYAFDYDFEPSKVSDSEREKTAQDLFRQVSMTNRLKLFEIYRLDFEMFGYTVDHYL